MKKLFFTLLFVILSAFSFISVYADEASDLNFGIFPGVFYFSIHGDLQDGVNLQGFLPADEGVYQFGYWNGEKGVDYIEFFDSTAISGFRIQTFLGGDFKYLGTDTLQGDVSASQFFIYGDYDTNLNQGKAPNLALDSDTEALNIYSADSCIPVGGTSYEDYYFFNTAFEFTDFKKSYSTEPFNYLMSTNSCVNKGRINLSRFELDLGQVSAGEYVASLYIIMLDGY